MPASVADPVACVLRTALSGKKGPFSMSSGNDETEENAELLEDRLAASAKRVLLSTVEYEPAPKQQIFSTDSLKSKYTVLTSNSTISKLAAINGSGPITTQESLPPPKVTLFRSEDVKVGWKGQVPVGTGMLNMGNTCYMNSTLQALFHVPSFCNWLLTGNQPCQACHNSSQPCLVCAVAKVLQSTREKHGTYIKPFTIYNRLKHICKHMVHGRQEDAHEFMRYFIEAMEKTYLQGVGGSKLDSRSKETNPLGQIFGGYIRTEVTCLKCKHISTTFQHFQDIPLDIQHASTLEDGLSHYFRRERLEGDNAYKCDKCKTKVPAMKKFSLERAPNVLCIQLKRFGLMGGKMSKHIQYSRSLNLDRFLFNNAGQSMGSSTYKFVSLINHMGPSQHCGHYTAIAEASNGNLYLFDDCSVRLISVNTALSTGAYVLIYERVQSAQTSTAPHSNGLQGSKMNGVQHTNNSTTAPPPPKVIPRPALITEPSRPKVSITFNKKVEPVLQDKPRLVIRNGATSLFKSAATIGPINSKLIVNGDQPKQEPIKATAPPTSTVPKLPTALVPYDGESSEEEEEIPVKSNGSTAISTNGTCSTQETLLTPVKATEAKWQVSPSPTPSETGTNGGTSSAIPTNTIAAKWRVSDNNQQDNTSSNSGGGGSNSSQSKWNVRSVSDTEADRATANPTQSECRKLYHSDTETDRPSASGSCEKEPLSHQSTKETALTDASSKPCEPDFAKASPKTEISTASNEKVDPPKETTAENTVPAPSDTLSTPVDKPDKPGKSSTSGKWDGSRGGDTVKELLRMSHSGFGDQVRTWDGGKSHLTKQVEDDKRMQRKRTADELLDEELDKGKVKKLKSVSKEENRDSNPAPTGYNPFQAFQDRNREQSQKPDHFKNDYSRNHNRNGYQGHRGGGRGGRGGRGSNHQYGGHQHRSQSRGHQPYRRFR